MSLLFLIQLFIFKVCLYRYVHISPSFLLLYFTEKLQSVPLPCFLSIYLSVSPLRKAEFHQTLCYHNQCFDKCLFICTCLNIYFCRIFLGFVSRRQITDSLHICILNFQWYFPKCLSWYFSTPAKRTVFCLCPSQPVLDATRLSDVCLVCGCWVDSN